MSDENTENNDKLAKELSDYLNEANKIPPVSQETLGCGNAMVYDDIYDTIIVDPKTLNVECNFLDRSLDMYVIPIFKGYLPDERNARKIFLDFLNNDNGMSYHKKIKVFFKDFDIYDVIKKVYNDLNDDLKNKNKKNADLGDVKTSINKILNIPIISDENTIYIYNNRDVAALIVGEIISLFSREIGGTIYYFGKSKRNHSDEDNLLLSLETAKQIIEYIKPIIEQENKDETNIKLIYTIFSCVKTTEKIQKLLQTNLLYTILNVISAMPTGEYNDFTKYIKDPNKVKNMNDYFKLPRIPNTNTKDDSKISNKLTILQYNNINHNFIHFDNDNNLIVTTYCTKMINIADYNSVNVFIIFLLNKREYNITKNTYSEYNKIYWTDDRLKNPENTFLINLTNIISPPLTPPNPITTGGTRKPRKTVKRKKNTTTKRKPSKSRKIMPRRRRHHRR